MIEETLYDDGHRSWHFFGRDPDKPDKVIDTNEFLVVDDGVGVMLDAGGMEVFPSVITAVSRRVGMQQIESLFASHQDPDILSSLALWVKVCPDAKVWVPRIWETFMTHFSFEADFHLIPDHGGILPLGASRDLQLIPAHYLHSSGNFSVYDPKARILWTGDIGAALLPPGENEIRVTDFDRHIELMDGFHRRWMPSERARDRWIDLVRGLDIDLMVPQHGKLFQGPDVDRFLEWFSQLELASALSH
jgi:flavorubredoxin